MRPHPPVRPRELRVVSDDRYADWRAVYEDNVDRIHRLMFAKVGNRHLRQPIWLSNDAAPYGPTTEARDGSEIPLCRVGRIAEPALAGGAAV